MKIAILGTGQVGNLIGSRLIEKGHQVMISGRVANNESGLTFVKNNPPGTASYGTFDAAPRYADIIFNATNGRFALEALKLADTDFADKILIDVANPLDFTVNPPTLIPEFANSSSLGESIQSRYPKARVVKTLNTLGMALAVNPTQLNQGDHSLFVAGNDKAAKTEAKAIVTEFGWRPDNVLAPVYDAYTTPAPPGLRETAVRPDRAYFDPQLGEFLLMYDHVRQSDKPRELLLDFLQSTYEAGANLGRWDRAALER